MKRISILSHDLSSNALSRAYTLGQLLSDAYHVSIVGPASDGKIWEPVISDDSIDIRVVSCSQNAWVLHTSRRFLRSMIDGDLIYTVKPLAGSFGAGLRARRILGRPLLLDIDDWELGFLCDSMYWEARLTGSRWLWDIRSPLFTRLLDKKISLADAITVSSTFLYERYGGTWIGQPRNEKLYHSSLNLVESRTTKRIKTAVFMGSARQHKGLRELLLAWGRLSLPDVVLRIVGTPLDLPLVSELRNQAPENVEFHGHVPYPEVPRVLRGADVIVVPQLPGRASVGQVPMKLVDAMAMGKPIVAGNAGDIPKWLGKDAGVVVDVADTVALGDALILLLANDELAAKYGANAYQRYMRLGSFEAIRPRLLCVIEDALAGRPQSQHSPPFNEHDVKEVELVGQNSNDISLN